MERLESFFENGPSGPGIFWCASRIRKPDQISWDSYIRWYEAEIIPLCLALEGSPLCFRAAAADYGNERPCVFVAAYSEAKALASFDASYLHHDGGKLLPGVDSVFDVVDFDCRWFTVLDVTEHVKKPLSEVKSFMTVGWDIKGDIEESVLDSWWKTHHAEHLARVPGFIRSTRFHAQQSWWSAGNGASLPCPDFFEIMEFETPDVDVMTIVGHANSSEEGLEIQDAIMEACHFEFASYRMERTWGEGVMYEKK